MLIKVLHNTKASKNIQGTEAFDYLAGETYEIYDELANKFINLGWGELVNNQETENNIEEKAIDNLENKAITNLENKKLKKNKNV